MAELTGFKVVYKYAFDPGQVATAVYWGPDSRAVLVAAQTPSDLTPCVWVEHTVDFGQKPPVDGNRALLLAGTGHPTPLGHEWIGSAVCADGGLVWHVYATTADQP